MANALSDMIRNAFASGERQAVRGALVRAVNLSAERMAEANRARLTEVWKDLAEAHYELDTMELTPELREQRGYLEAIVHLTKAIRDRSDDLEALQKVKKHRHGPAILAAIREEGAIRHGELADRLGISAPSLTQTIKALAESGTITATVHGKFKYYSLTPLGNVVAARTTSEMPLRERLVAMRTALSVALEAMRDPTVPEPDDREPILWPYPRPPKDVQQLSPPRRKADELDAAKIPGVGDWWSEFGQEPEESWSSCGRRLDPS